MFLPAQKSSVGPTKPQTRQPPRRRSVRQQSSTQAPRLRITQAAAAAQKRPVQRRAYPSLRSRSAGLEKTHSPGRNRDPATAIVRSRHDIGTGVRLISRCGRSPTRRSSCNCSRRRIAPPRIAPRRIGRTSRRHTCRRIGLLRRTDLHSDRTWRPAGVRP